MADDSQTAYTLGILAAALEAQGYLTNLHAAKPDAPVHIQRALREYTAQTPTNLVGYVTSIIDDLPMTAFSIQLIGIPGNDSMYWLGYYHGKAQIANGEKPSTKRRGRTTPLHEPVSANITLESDLWEWTKANGGAELVRALLAAERARRTQLNGSTPPPSSPAS